MQRRAEVVAAVVNGVVVLFAPVAAIVIAGMIDPVSDSSTSVRAPGAPFLADILAFFGPMLVGLLPFALFAGWRTHVHAARWRERGDRGWRAVAEAGLLAFAVAIIYLAPGILTRPFEAPPYVIAYGGAAVVLGLLVGLMLRFIAILALKWQHASTVTEPAAPGHVAATSRR